MIIMVININIIIVVKNINKRVVIIIKNTITTIMAIDFIKN